MTPTPMPPSATPAQDTARVFYQHMHGAYDALRAAMSPEFSMAQPLMALAWRSYEDNVQVQAQDEGPVACGRGCATCCALRVAATAPEVLVVVGFLRQVLPLLKERGVDLLARIQDVDARTRGAAEAERLQLREHCPFVAQGVCVIYQVRPLACRSHVSFDVRACVQAMRGEDVAVPYSPSRQWVRAIVQNAMQSSLRDGDLDWGLFELNQAVLIGLAHRAPEGAWRRGERLFEAARIREIPEAEMVEAFEALRGGE